MIGKKLTQPPEVNLTKLQGTPYDQALLECLHLRFDHTKPQEIYQFHVNFPTLAPGPVVVSIHESL